MKDSHNRVDLEARLRRDPRRDPTDPPPPNDNEPASPKVEIVDTSEPPPAEAASPPSTKEHVGAAAAAVGPPKSEDEEPPSRRRALPPVARDQAPPRSAGAGSVITSSDPRIPDLEKALASGNWNATLELLGPPAESGRLPPNLGVLYAIAMKEKERHDAPATDLNELAIRCTAGLLGVTHDSPIALLFAKRLLRRNPVALHKRPAPRPTISILIVVITVFITGTLSWLISFGYLQFSFHLP